MTLLRSPIRVMVLEDDGGLREALVALLTQAPGFVCAGAYDQAEQALGCLPGQKPDLVLVDLELNQGPNGIEFLRTCRRRFPEVELLVLTIHDEAEWLFPALAAGASGYVIKGLANEKLLEAIIEVQQGGSFMSSSVARRMLEVFRRINQDPAQLEGLTTRETEVLRHLARGLRYDEIAAELKIGARTVNTHLHHIYRKLHVHSATGAVARYLKNQAPGER